MIDVDKKNLEIIKKILEKYVPDCEIKIFGSRVNGDARSHSDIDIAINSSSKLNLKIKTQLKSAFEESDLPFRVDILDWNSLPDSFKEIINKNNITLKTSEK